MTYPTKTITVLIALFAIGCSSDPEESPSPDPDAGSDMALADVEVSDDASIADVSLNDAGADMGTEPDMNRTVFERGAYNVGHRRWEITYASQVYGERELKLSVWYPTLDEEGPPGLYVVNYQRQEVIGNASVAITEPAPLLVFSHGNAAIAEQSYFMTEFFASHGWIVVAPYHTGNTVFDTEGAINLESGGVRPQDVTAVIDAMYALDSSDPLSGLISDKIVLSGHSFGAYTTLASSGAEYAVDEVVALCEQPNPPSECEMLAREGVEDLMRTGFYDDRIDAAIPQAPGGFFVFQDSGIAAIDTPTLLFTGARDITLEPEDEGEPIWAAMDGRHMRVDVLRAGHFTFSNMCELIPVGPVVEDGCSEDFVSIDIAFPLINAFSLAFSNYILFGDESGLDLLQGTDTRWASEIELDYKDPLVP